MTDQPERQRILDKIADVLAEYHREYPYHPDFDADGLAEVALRVIEQSNSDAEPDYSRICTCGQNGYNENSINSNHPHRKGCPQYTGLYEGK